MSTPSCQPNLITTLLEPTSLGESNNPSAPQLWGLFPFDQQGWLTLTQWWGLLPRIIINHLGPNSLGESNNPRAPQL